MTPANLTLAELKAANNNLAHVLQANYARFLQAALDGDAALLEEWATLRGEMSAVADELLARETERVREQAAYERWIEQQYAA